MQTFELYTLMYWNQIMRKRPPFAHESSVENKEAFSYSNEGYIENENTKNS